MFDLFSDFFDLFPVYYEEKSCPKCGMTYSELQKRGRVGCSECYNTFRNPIDSMVRQIHQSNTHVGKIPDSCAKELKLKKRYEYLKKEIASAVSKEDYETAAKLHKELKELGGENQ